MPGPFFLRAARSRCRQEFGDWGQVGSGNVTELRGGRAQQGRSTGSRTLMRDFSGALDRLGSLIGENIRGNREREGRARQERQRVEDDRGPERARQYIRGGAQRSDVQRTSDTVEFMRRTRGLPQPAARSERAPYLARNDMQEAIDLVAEASASDSRARANSVTEENPVANGAVLTRGEGPGRRGVLQQPFVVRVDGQDVAVSDDQRTVLSEYIREHPRAFPTFADWYNAISTIDGNEPDQLSVESIAMARRQWDNPEQGGPSRGLEPPDATFTLDPNYVRARGDVNYGAEYNYRNIDMGIDPETGQRRIVGQRTSAVRGPQGPAPDAPVSARRPITPEERLTAESELMRIMNRNRAESGRGRSRTIQRAANTDPSTRTPILELPRQIAETVIARSRLADDVRDLRRQAQDGPPGTKAADKGLQKNGTLMTPQEVVEEQVAQQQAAATPQGGYTLDDPERDPFTREAILPIRPPEEEQSGGSRTIDRLRRAGRVSVGGMELEPTDNGVRGSIRW